MDPRFEVLPGSPLTQGGGYKYEAPRASWDDAEAYAKRMEELQLIELLKQQRDTPKSRAMGALGASDEGLVRRSDYLPVSRRQDGGIAATIPQTVIDALAAGMTPGMAAEGRDISLNDAVNMGMQGLGSTAAAGGIAAMTGRAPSQGIAAMFAGPMAKGKKRELAAAQKMYTGGATNEEVRQATGWFLGPDDQWRFEIDDSPARFIDDFGSGTVTLGSLMDHPELYKAYPWLKKMPVEVRPEHTSSGGAYFPKDIAAKVGRERAFIQLDGNGARLVLPEKVLSRTLALRRRTNEHSKVPRGAVEDRGNLLLHEIQHAIQDFEGRQMGGNPETAGRLAIAAGMDPKVVEAYDEGRELYPRLLGEVEARNTEFRRTMTADERRQVTPSKTEDVARRDQLYPRFGGIGTGR